MKNKTTKSSKPTKRIVAPNVVPPPGDTIPPEHPDTPKSVPKPPTPPGPYV